jgi:hypothetical protein
MAIEKYTSDKGTPEQRIANRLKPSCDTANTDHLVIKGEGPTRVAHAIHSRGQGAAPRRVKVEDK